MSDHETLHATTIAIERGGVWLGILLTGKSGAGKSDLALRLIDRGARLVSDDYTDMRRAETRLIASPPVRIAGKIEVRGLGIIETAYLAEVPAVLIIRLDGDTERMPEARTARIAGVDLPFLSLAPFEASAPHKVEIALDLLGKAS